MNKKISWAKYEDQILQQAISKCDLSSQNKIRWNLIQKQLKEKYADWKRTGKQCRQRWLNCHVLKSQQLTQNDVEKFIKLLRRFGKSWSTISKQFIGKNTNIFKNFFYSNLRKGIVNLNFYNNELREEKIYKKYDFKFINKLLSVDDKKKKQNIKIFDDAVYQIALDIRQKILICSQKNIKNLPQITNEQKILYQQINQLIIQFSKLCRYKKVSYLKRPDLRKDDQKYSIKLVKKTGRDLQDIQTIKIDCKQQQMNQIRVFELYETVKQNNSFTQLENMKEIEFENKKIQGFLQIKSKLDYQQQIQILNQLQSKDKKLFQILIQDDHDERQDTIMYQY